MVRRQAHRRRFDDGARHARLTKKGWKPKSEIRNPRINSIIGAGEPAEREKKMVKINKRAMIEVMKNFSGFTNKIYPMLECVHIQIEGENSVLVTGTNIDFWLRYRFYASFPAGENFNAVLNTKKLTAILAFAQGESVILDSSSGPEILTLRNDSGAVIGTMPMEFMAVDFPEPPGEIGCLSETIIMDTRQFIEGLNAVLPAVSPENHKYSFNTARLAVDGNGWRWMGTDGTMGTICQVQNPSVSGDSMDVLIPRDSAKILTKILAKNHDSTGLSVHVPLNYGGGDPWLFGRAGNMEFGCRLLNSVYPDLEKVMNEPSNFWCRLCGEEFTRALKSFSKQEYVTLELEDSSLYITAPDGTGTIVFVDRYDVSNSKPIKMDPKKLLDLLKVFPGDLEIKSTKFGGLGFNQKIHPAGTVHSLLMPMN
jgi:DNA polymerase III sliding clamp (beta) subunit (PCNA family)